MTQAEESRAEQRLEHLIARLPRRMAAGIRWVRQPSQIWLRVPLGLLLFGCGFLAIFVVEGGEIVFPPAYDGCKRPVPAHAGLDPAPFFAGEHTQNVFTSEDFVAGAVTLALVWGRHRSKHSLNFKRLRRSQVRIVLSGTL